MKTVMVFILGLGLGFYYGKKIESKSVKIVDEVQRSDCTPELPQVITAKKETTQKLNSIKSNALNGIEPQIKMQIPQEASKYRVTLTVNEDTISDLESHMSELRADVKTIIRDGGWEFVFRNENNLLAQAGVKNGDFVTYERVTRDLGNLANPQITDRTIALFNNLAR